MLLEGWKEAKLADVCQFLNGRAYKKEELQDKGKYPVLRVGNFFTNDSWYYSDLELDEEKYCENGDLLYAWSASFAPRIWSGAKVIYHYHIWKIVIDPLCVDKQYLYYFLEWDVDNIKSTEGSGSTMIHITKGSIEQRSFHLPPLEEQRRIAEVLRSVDEATAAARRGAEAAAQVFKSARDELIDNARAEFDEITVAEALSKNRGEKLRKLQTSAYRDEGAYPIVDQGANFVCGYTDDADALWPYSLPVIVFGDHTLALKFVDFPFVIGADGTQCLSPIEGVLPRYLYYAIQSLDLNSEGYARHFKLLKEKVIPLPDEGTQSDIVAVLIELERAHENAINCIRRMEHIKKAVAHDLLSGGVRVPA